MLFSDANLNNTGNNFSTNRLNSFYLNGKDERALSTFTDSIYIELKDWEKILANSADWLSDSTQQDIIDFMNDQKKICTPGFLLRRQIQNHFKELMATAAKNADIDLNSCKDLPIAVNPCNDLQKVGNVPWSENFVSALAKVLSDATFVNYDRTQKLLDQEKWLNYLTDKTSCNRKLAIKLIFALEMDEATSANFLISTDNTLLSARNPFDYICQFCLTCKPRLSYKDAVELLAAFEIQRTTAFDDKKPHDKTGSVTDALVGKMRDIAQNVDISTEDKKNLFKAYMLSNSGEFVNKVPKKNQKLKDAEEYETEYLSGFSFRNIENLKKLMEYLSRLYPTEIKLNQDGGELKIFLSLDANDKINVSELIQAIFYEQDIELRESSELQLPARGAERNQYDAIPFNNMVLRFKTLVSSLRETMRSGTSSKNTKDISRGTIMILAYFFITGYLYSDEGTANAFKAQLQQDKDLPNSNHKKLTEALFFGVQNLDVCKDSAEPIHIYIAALNVLLSCFGFNEFYPPFVLDRFLMIALLANPLNAPLRDNKYENSLRYFIQCVIDKNYRNRIATIATKN